MSFTFIELIVMSIVACFILYILLDRVMRCIERCAVTKAYGKISESGVRCRSEDISNTIENFNRKMSDVRSEVKGD